MEHAAFDPARVRAFADLAVEGLEAAREEIDALNVYPVPDGDTGTNMYLTVESARSAIQQLPEDAGLGAQLAAYSRGALLGARGNGGVILAQLVGALFRRMAQAGPEEHAAEVFAEGMRAATDAAYAAVGRPMEGTILSVAAAAAEAAARAASDPDPRLATVLGAAAEAATQALARTSEQLPVLTRAGVVDAGGRGLCVVLDAAESALTGKQPSARRRIPQPIPGSMQGEDLTEDGPAYEVMYLLETRDERVPRLRQELAALGDSLVVVGGDGLWNVHVHTDDVGAAVEAGIRAGTPRRIAVTHFAEQVARARERRAARVRGGRGVVAVAAGPGLSALFREAGARVIEGGPGLRPSAEEFRAAIAATGAAEVIVLPNDEDSVGVARAAAHAAEEETEGLHVVVVPTRAQVQGIAALACHEAGRPLDDDVVSMAAGARGARHAALTVATRQAMTTAGRCEPGDVLGAIAGDFVLVGRERAEVATGLLDRLLSSGGELVTLVPGEDAGDLAQHCEEWVRRQHPGVDVVVHDGGQPRYPLLLAVE